jgi:tRNA (guanine37-N1)-methyltransferase
MRIDIITIFPKIFDSYLAESLIKKAQDKKLLTIKVHNLRKWAAGKHRQVDDRPFGGGLGMVMMVEPIFKAIRALKPTKNTKVILFTPRGEKFDQKTAYQLSKLDRIIMICGRYEGVDERVAKNIADVELSIGDYDLMGGEIPAMAVLETTARLIPGVIGKKEFLKERITKEKGFIEYPQYTRPEVFKIRGGKTLRAPKILLSGDQKKVGEWRKINGKIIGK